MHSSHPVLRSLNDGRYNEANAKDFVTGRVGYNNTPLVRRRRESLGTFSPPKLPHLPRTVSAYGQEELYFPRARMVDVLHSDEDHDVVQLPSGVRQKVPRSRHSGSESGLRRRKINPKQIQDRGTDIPPRSEVKPRSQTYQLA